MRTLIKFLPLVLLFFLGCAGKNAAPTVTGSANLNDMQVASTGVDYRIQPGDLLDVKFFYNPELNEQVTVRSDGRITLQLVNDVVAAGITPTELTKNLTEAYAKEIVTPRVTVIVRTPVADKVFVDGEVNKAGMVTINGPTTAVQSIALAGGLKESANAKSVVIIRREGGGNVEKIYVDVSDARNGGPDSDVRVRSNDIIYVPKSTISNVNNWIDLYIRKNIPLPVGLGYSIR